MIAIRCKCGLLYRFSSSASESKKCFECFKCSYCFKELPLRCPYKRKVKAFRVVECPFCRETKCSLDASNEQKVKELEAGK